MFEVNRNNCSGINKIDYDKVYTYEEVVSLLEPTDPEHYTKVIDFIDADNLEEALEYLKQWHYPGEHMINSHKLHLQGEYYIKDGYILNINQGLGIIDLAFIIPPEDL